MPRGQASDVGAKTVNKNGYEQIKTKDGWIGTHVFLMEEKLGRRLGSGERVRFIDGDRTNLCIDNLEVYYLKSGSLRRQLSSLDERIRELQAQRAYVQAQLDKTEASSKL